MSTKSSSPSAWRNRLARSLWTRTIISLLWGLAISISLVLNLSHSNWLAPDTLLLVGILLAFTLWASVMVYCLAHDHLKPASVGCLKVLIPSVLLNGLQLLF